MNLSRRSVLTGLITAPLVVRTPGLLMPVRSWHNGIRGQIGWVVDPGPIPPFPINNLGDRLYLHAVISDGRRWIPYNGQIFPFPIGGRPAAGPAPVDGPAAICA